MAKSKGECDPTIMPERQGEYKTNKQGDAKTGYTAREALSRQRTAITTGAAKIGNQRISVYQQHVGSAKQGGEFRWKLGHIGTNACYAPTSQTTIVMQIYNFSYC